MVKLRATEFQPGDVPRFGDEQPLVEPDGDTFLLNFQRSETLVVDPLTPGDFTVTRKRDGKIITFTPWKYQTWAVLDLETTGVELECKIVEIAIVRMRFGRVLDVWATLVNPGVPIPSAATSVHGIDDAMVAGKPHIEELHDIIAQKLEGVAATVAYNGYGFDEKVLTRNGIELPVPLIDPMVIVKTKAVSAGWESTWQPRPESPDDLFEPEETEPEQRQKPGGKYRLSSVAERLGCVYPEDGVDMELHRAAWDSVLAGRVLWQVRQWVGASAELSSEKLREEGQRQQRWLDEFRAKMNAKDAARLNARREAGREVVNNNRQWLKDELAAMESRLLNRMMP